MTTPTTKPPTGNRMRYVQWSLSAALVVIVGLNVWWFGFHDTKKRHPLEGQPAPAFGLAVIDAKGLDGQRLTLEDHRGKVVLLDFWATHCAPCKRQMPILEKLQQEVGEDKMRVVSVNLDFEPDASRIPKVSKFLAEGGFTFPVVLGHREVMQQYQFTRIPFMVVVDAQGTVRSAHSGLRSQKRLRAEIDEFLP